MSDSFSDRFKRYLHMTDPRTLIYSDDSVREAQNRLKSNPNGDDEQTKFDKRLVDAAIHPVTGEIIPRWFRVSAIAPVNIPLVFAMLSCPATNVPGTLFLHWLNQSYNTACNYANRSGASQSIEQTAKAYGLAVSSACGFAYGLGKAFEKAPPSLRRLKFIIPCLATIAANVSNVAFTRLEELQNGTPVFDAENEVYGMSKIAGFNGVAQTAVTRCALVPCACLVLPPVTMAMMKSMKLLPSGPKALMALELGIIYLSLQAVLPAALAVFPQKQVFQVQQLEPQFRNIVKKNGEKLTVLYANKGL